MVVAHVKLDVFNAFFITGKKGLEPLTDGFGDRYSTD